jgi:hypothetical protein
MVTGIDGSVTAEDDDDKPSGHFAYWCSNREKVGPRVVIRRAVAWHAIGGASSDERIGR